MTQVGGQLPANFAANCPARTGLAPSILPQH